MKKAILIALCLSGCASLTKDVFENIHEGDPAAKVSELYGTPDAIAPSQNIPGAHAWFFQKNGDLCGFTIHDNTVKRIACVSGPSPTRMAIANGLRGMGQGLQNSSQRAPLTCTPNGIGQLVCR